MYPETEKIAGRIDLRRQEQEKEKRDSWKEMPERKLLIIMEREVRNLHAAVVRALIGPYVPEDLQSEFSDVGVMASFLLERNESEIIGAIERASRGK